MECIIGAAMTVMPRAIPSLRLVMLKRILSPTPCTNRRTGHLAAKSPRAELDAEGNFDDPVCGVDLYHFDRSRINWLQLGGLRDAPAENGPVCRAEESLAGAGLRYIFANQR